MPDEPRGLTAQEAARRLAADGPNTLPGARRHGWVSVALEAAREPMFLLLAAGILIYVLLGDRREALILAASLVLVVGITVVQERRSERAVEALRDLSSPRALVIRDGVAARVSGAAVVRGDLIVLAEGDRVPADGRVVAANDLMLDESLLTGESLPVARPAGTEVASGTLVVRGQGRALVTAIGASTAIGRIGRSLAAIDPGRTPLQIETGRVVRRLALLAILLCVGYAAFDIAVRRDWLEGVLSGITLAMAMLPEEFPVVLTVFLALGAWRIARHGVLTRRMPAIETLGAATALCVDKTGTLTENRMAVVETRAAGGDDGRLRTTAALACEPEPFDPMERAVVAAGGDEAAALRLTWTLQKDYPLTRDFLAVCHAWQSPRGERRVAVKGAPETVLALCGLPAGEAARVLAGAGDAADRGHRVLGVAEAEWTGDAWPDDPRVFRCRWLGFVALADPLRPEVPEAVAVCRRAGIRVVMVTGDYPATGLAIARQAGIPVDSGVLTGEAVAALDDRALAEAARRVHVFARVRPEQKLRLVSAMRAAGEIVAMTGDGVNDAPALKAAHIGVAMGLRGTDVAREASSLVLLQDSFGSIVLAIRQGRRIYDNIRNAMRYLLAVHVPIAGLSFVPLLLGWPVFLFPVHIVFLEFVIDPACSIVFEAEPEDDAIMRRPPRSPAQPLFGARMLGISLLLGVSVLAVICGACAWAVARGLDDRQVRSLGFAAVVFGNLAMIHVTRSRDQALRDAWRRPNRSLWWITFAAVAALAAALYVPAAADVFRFAPLSPGRFALAALAGVTGVSWYEMYKALRPRMVPD